MEPWHPKPNARTGIGAIRRACPGLPPPRAAGNVPAAAGASCGARPVAMRLAWLWIGLLGMGQSARGGVEVLADVHVFGDFVRVGERLVFAGSDSANGIELWITDGTPEGTRLLRDVYPGPASSDPRLAPTATGGVLLFAADDGIHGRELWRTDGTSQGTVLLRDINPGAEASNPNGFEGSGDSLYFAATTFATGREVWKASGAPLQVELLADVCPGSCSSLPYDLTVSGGRLYFGAERPDIGQEPFRSDGSAASTILLLDIVPGSQGSAPQGFARRGTNSVAFSASSADKGAEPWSSGGTTGTTDWIADIAPGSGGSHPIEFASVGSRLLLSASAFDSGREPYRCVVSPSPACTRLRDIAPGTASSYPSEFVESVPGSGIALFAAENATYGRELWRTDGSEAGTWLVRDTEPGPAPGAPRLLTQTGGYVHFFAGELGRCELWRSDGTAAGTQALTDIDALFSVVRPIALGERIVFATLLASGGRHRPLALHPGLFQDGFEPPPPTTPASATEEP